MLMLLAKSMSLFMQQRLFTELAREHHYYSNWSNLLANQKLSYSQIFSAVRIVFFHFESNIGLLFEISNRIK